MVKNLSLWGFLVIVVFIYSLTIGPVRFYRENLRKTIPVLYLPPTELLQAFSLDYKNIISQLLMFRASIYYGERIQSKTFPDWHWFYKMLYTSVELDPYNIDSHYLAQAILPWEVNMVKETNAILEKGINTRTWDWYLPFFMGFNQFYFLKDNKKAARYFSKAALINPQIAVVAGNFFQKAGESRSGINFLELMLEKTNDDTIRMSISKRIDSLEKVLIVRNAVSKFKSEYERLPGSFKEIVSAGILDRVPVDPYGKSYVMNKEGKIDLHMINKYKGASQ